VKQSTEGLGLRVYVPEQSPLQFAGKTFCARLFNFIQRRRGAVMVVTQTGDLYHRKSGAASSAMCLNADIHADSRRRQPWRP
jgi:hypothetical protein